MNIQSIAPSLYINNSRNVNRQNRPVNNQYATRPMLNTLAQDTVSFVGAGKASRVAKKATTDIAQLITDGYEAKMPKYQIIGTRLMDTLQVITEGFKAKGLKVFFDREDCQAHMVKGSGSFLSKLKRSGESPMDRVRATLYVENPYDLEFIGKELLPALNSRGYSIYMAPDKVSGRRVLSRKPDFDIRLESVRPETIKYLPPELRECVGKPQKSGYEDIQMRLVDAADTAKEKTPIELLIVFGKNYSKAKHDESYYVYDITRALKNELHVSRVDSQDPKSPEYRIKNNIGVIVDCLNTNISKPLFINGKSMDFYHEKPTIPVDLNPSDCGKIRGLLNGIREKIDLYYRRAGVETASEKSAIRHIKATADYKAREDKTISPEEISAKRKELVAKVKGHRAEDLELIRRVQDRFEETAEKYGVQPAETKEV